ncbi:TerC/Alx family metal homeostasis membrane protein [Estrella lausannensis]|uniref:Conserved putative membrane protein n=1 Tax=Estrella lausannensis TaxID=483423 RepID=A0A0H5DRD0_9BACT|nr:TerC/Alx family metal homeostasis membrane protein [Estrella lausannensis]CRX38229.1 Conserved putative membrane protein [Estrella lausannensis]
MIFWILFLIAISLMIYLDLFFEKKKGLHEMTFGESMTWTLIWVSAALLFNLGVYWLYEHHMIYPESSPHSSGGKEAALLFFTGYLVEKSLSLDNVFVIALIFSYFHVPPHLQHRVLIWGVFGAIVLRFVMILFGAALITHFTFMNYIFGAILIFTAVKMLVIKQENMHPETNPVIMFAKKLMPVTHEFHGANFFVRINGVLMMTPLFLSLLVVETSDVIFAIDSIPAIFSITTDPFLVFTSNIFAILGLRSLYFVLATAINRFYYLRFSLVFLLAFVGVKMLTAHHYPIDTTLSLYIILGILLVGVAASLITKDGFISAFALPIYIQFRDIAIMTAKDIRRIAVLFAGIVILLAGLAMLVLPGPGLIFIPIGLMLLAKEFLWARRLLNKLRNSNKTFQKILGSPEEEKGDK